MGMVYISGKITGTDDYLERFAAAEDYINGHFDGWKAVNPARVCACLPEETPYEVYMNVTLEILKSCDAIFMLDGYENSNGAMTEYRYALATGKAVFFEGESPDTVGWCG